MNLIGPLIISFSLISVCTMTFYGEQTQAPEKITKDEEEGSSSTGYRVICSPRVMLVNECYATRILLPGGVGILSCRAQVAV